MISFLIGILSGCSHTTSTHTIQKDLSKDQIIEINYDDVLKKINQKEDFVLLPKNRFLKIRFSAGLYRISEQFRQQVMTRIMI